MEGSTTPARAAFDNLALRRAFKAGDRDALVACYRALVGDVAAIARRGFLLGDEGVRVPGIVDPDAQLDVVQETFARAFAPGARASYDGLRPLRPWVLRIQKNLMIDRFRRGETQACPFDPVHDLEEVLTDDRPLHPERGEAALDARRLQQAVADFVRALDDEARAVHQLRFAEGLGQELCAKRLGCSRRRVRAVEDALRDGLREHLSQRGLLDVAAGRVGVHRARPAVLGAAAAVGLIVLMVLSGCIDPTRNACRDSLDCLDGAACFDGLCGAVSSDGRCEPRIDGEDGCGRSAICVPDPDGDHRCESLPSCDACGGFNEGVCNDGFLAGKDDASCLLGRCERDGDCDFEDCVRGSVDDALGFCSNARSICFVDDDCIAASCEGASAQIPGTCSGRLPEALP